MVKKFKYIGVIGDVHTEDKFLEKAIEFLKLHKVEAIFCVGDIADGLGDIDRCCDILMREKIIVVLGNHDRWLLKEEMRNLKEADRLNFLSDNSKQFLSSLPATYEFLTTKGLALLCHGLGKNDMARLTPHDYGYAIETNTDLQNLIRAKKYKYIINGHTHYKMVRKFGNLTIINAGTLKRDCDSGFLIVDVLKDFVQFYKFVEYAPIIKTENVSLKTGLFNFT